MLSRAKDLMQIEGSGVRGLPDEDGITFASETFVSIYMINAEVVFLCVGDVIKNVVCKSSVCQQSSIVFFPLLRLITLEGRGGIYRR